MTLPLDAGAMLLKDPGSLEPFGFDWTDWLVEIGEAETLTASEWTVTGPDALLTIDNEALVTGNVQTQVVLAGGTLGVRYTVTNRITTSSGYADERSFFVKVEHR